MILNPVVRRSSMSAKGGRYYAQGVCPVCGSKVNKLIKKVDVKVDEPAAPPVEEPTVVYCPGVVAEEPKPKFKAFCRNCWQESDIIGGALATLWDKSKVVVNGKCAVCGWTGIMLNASEKPTEVAQGDTGEEF
jgi:hypothetical protein